MTKIVLIGDSIRIGYETAVRRGLQGKAEVWTPPENGGNTRNVLAHIQEWGVDPGPDVIHVNAGLHDIKVDRDTCKRAVSADEYRRNVRMILETLQDRTDASILWATTTPVDPERHNRGKPFDRFESDVIECNDAAREVCHTLGVEISDLHSCAAEMDLEEALLDDGVHFTPEAYETLGSAVVHRLADWL